VAAVVDARRGEVFCARYDGPEAPRHGPQRWSPAELAERLGEEPGILAVGGGALRYAGALDGVAIAPGLADPDARAVAALAARRIGAGEEPGPPGALRPLYLREADARINWAQR
jgi:tRNA A37 threonylcarbamoyladenosine modification protein TsaB